MKTVDFRHYFTDRNNKSYIIISKQTISNEVFT